MGLSLSASQSSVCAGPTVTISPSGQLPDGAKLQWNIGGEAAGQSPTLDFPTSGKNAGSYNIGLKVSADGYNDASADTTVTVRGYQPPSGTLGASPSEIYVGDKSTLSPDFKAGQCGGTLQPAAFQASEGSVSGAQFDSTGVAFDPNDTSEQRKTVTVTASVSDGKGTGTAQTQIVVKKRANPAAKRLPDIVFAANNARVNNCAKRVLLEELKTYTDSDTTGTVVLIGHKGEKEKAADLDSKRAKNAAAVISAGSGICTAFPAAQIQVGAAGTDQSADFQPRFCGTSAGIHERSGQAVKENDEAAKPRRVEVWFVPTNGKPPAEPQGMQDAAAAGVASLGCPK